MGAVTTVAAPICMPDPGSGNVLVMQTTIETPEPAVPPPAGPERCPGPCRVTESGRLSRDSECPLHGVEADRRWWRTPLHLRETFDDALPPEPRMTLREAMRDEQLLRGSRR